jgi:hypothetical protein
MKKLCLGFSTALLAACSGGSTTHELFTPKPECKGDAIVPYMGTKPQVISNLTIGAAADGFDLDGDGKPDNKLGGVSNLAAPAIADSFKNYSSVIPFEFFNFPAVAQTSCVKFAIYLGAYVTDSDGDGKKAYIKGGDCNDKDAAIHPGATEIIGNFKDDNCDGKADETDATHPSTDMMDRDGDGYSMAQGDCDDTNPNVHPGAKEICGDGLDNDCDGVADYSASDPMVCSPFDPANPKDIPLDKLSFDSSGAPVIVFNNGSIDKNLQLHAGPSLFSVNIPVTGDITLDLKITGATIQADVQADGTLKNGKLGGVIDARTADTITGLNVTQIGLTPDQSLLDATFANLLGTLLTLPKANAAVQKKYPGCRTPDIDVDGDGLEAFCSSDPTGNSKVVDVCIDGDGTEIKSTFDANGKILTHCAQATLPNGKPRFVDGISVELNFETAPIKSIKPPK